MDSVSVTSSFATKQIKFIISTYNSIIEDIHVNLRKKDPYAIKSIAFKILQEPTVDDLVKTFFRWGHTLYRS